MKNVKFQKVYTSSQYKLKNRNMQKSISEKIRDEIDWF